MRDKFRKSRLLISANFDEDTLGKQRPDGDKQAAIKDNGDISEFISGAKKRSEESLRARLCTTSQFPDNTTL
jgi:hypothetical protein